MTSCKIYVDVEDMEGNSVRDLRAIPQHTFQYAFQNWKKKDNRCVSRVEGSTVRGTSLIEL